MKTIYLYFQFLFGFKGAVVVALKAVQVIELSIPFWIQGGLNTMTCQPLARGLSIPFWIQVASAPVFTLGTSVSFNSFLDSSIWRVPTPAL